MTEKKTTKSKKSNAKKTAKPKVAKKAVALPPEMWKCKVGWVRFRGRRFVRDEEIMILPSQETEAGLENLKRYFDKTETASVKVESEPVEALTEENNHASD